MADVVLLHGFTQTGRAWDPVRAALDERLTAFAPDLPGHGDAAHRRPATVGACVAYLHALPADAFVLGGYSMGGRIALHAALTIPGKIARLVLIGDGQYRITWQPTPGDQQRTLSLTA